MKKNTEELKLITLDDLIKIKQEKIINQLNQLAEDHFNEGKISFEYYIPSDIWALEEIKTYITKHMEKSDWHFVKIEDFKSPITGQKLKKIEFSVCLMV